MLLNKPRLFVVLSILFLFNFFNCLKRSDVLKSDKGIVVAKSYKSELNSSGVGVGINPSSGEMVTVVQNQHESAKFNIVFRCENGATFTIDDDIIYSKFKENDSVIISYYEWINEKGEVRDFDFVNANKF